MITYIALIMGLFGLLLGWTAHRKNKELRERIAQVNSRVYHLRREMQESQEQAEYELTKLKFELLKLQGDLKVTGQMKIGEIMGLHPQARQLLAGFHLGGCASCVVDEQQSLSEAALLNGREIEPILMALNTLLVTEPENGQGQISPEPFKTPNVQLQF